MIIIIIIIAIIIAIIIVLVINSTVITVAICRPLPQTYVWWENGDSRSLVRCHDEFGDAARFARDPFQIVPQCHRVVAALPILYLHQDAVRILSFVYELKLLDELLLQVHNHLIWNTDPLSDTDRQVLPGTSTSTYHSGQIVWPKMMGIPAFLNIETP